MVDNVHNYTINIMMNLSLPTKQPTNPTQQPTTKPLKAGERAYIKMSTYEYGKKRVIDCVIVIRHASISNNTYRSGAEFVMMSRSNKEFLSRLIQRMNPHEKDDSCALRKITFS